MNYEHPKRKTKAVFVQLGSPSAPTTKALRKYLRENEYFIINSLNTKIKKIKAIYFEHHYDFMIVKNYTFSQMHSILTKNGFSKFYKAKMTLRKTFDYIYINKEFFNDKI